MMAYKMGAISKNKKKTELNISVVLCLMLSL